MNSAPSFFLRSLLEEKKAESKSSHHATDHSTTTISSNSTAAIHMNGLEKSKEIVNKAIDVVSTKTKSIYLSFNLDHL
jgi:hypothetical protein